ncbi:MAG: hypothetical protein Q4C47_08020 [Planctomycetia bacterium]|nr:hypothetical protein [Planctomycetia bacterium]
MRMKVYVPQYVEIPDHYLPALADRVVESLGPRAGQIYATRGHLVRQAIQDGILRDFESLIGEDGCVDLVCDPAMETPLVWGENTVTLADLASGRVAARRAEPVTVTTGAR